MSNHCAPAGELSLVVTQAGVTKAPFAWKVRNFPNLWRGLWRAKLAETVARITGLPVMVGRLYLVLNTPEGQVDYGLVGMRVVTTAAVTAIVDAIEATFTISNWKYHAFGTGVGAEAVGNTALGTEMTTQYATDNVRPTGTQVDGASANIYETVATFAPDSGGTIAITEHGILSQAATGGGTLLDRTVFSAINLVAASDSLQATYDLTFASGG